MQNEGRERLLKTAISGVRREVSLLKQPQVAGTHYTQAHKAKQGQDLMRSQLLASFTMPSGVALGGDGEGETFTAGGYPPRLVHKVDRSQACSDA